MDLRAGKEPKEKRRSTLGQLNRPQSARRCVICLVRSTLHRPSSGHGYAISLRFFNGRTLTTFLAGLALKIASSPVNGLIPLRSFVAGLCCTTILQSPGIENCPGPRRPRAFWISSDSASNTAPTSFFDSSVASAMLLRISVLVGAFLAAVFAMFSDPPCQVSGYVGGLKERPSAPAARMIKYFGRKNATLNVGKTTVYAEKQRILRPQTINLIVDTMQTCLLDQSSTPRMHTSICAV